jgi:uncharacterized membrane protein
MIIAVALHVLAALIWVGGLFFILLILRPASIRIEPPQRFRLFAKVFSRYFPWVWGAIALLLITGYWMLFSRLGGFAEAGLHIQVMQVLGIAMMLIFGHLYHTPYKCFRAAVEEENWAKTNYQANRIRRALRWNLLLGLIVFIVATTGRYWA